MKHLILLALLWAAATAQAQSSCSSDGQPRPVAVMERFINADCAGCWADVAAPRPAAGALAVDWVATGAQGEDGALAAVATRDAADRLESLGRALPGQTSVLERRLAAPAPRLRVAHGLPYNDYVGVSIALRGAGSSRGGLTGWLVLLETLPAGTEGSTVERQLVRNALRVDWSRPARSRSGLREESRAMRIPEGVRAERLRVAGWVEDAQGRLVTAAASRCGP
jgi:hypothetical protein